LSLVLLDDPQALDVLDTTIKYLGIGIANLMNGLNPEMVVIGGEITKVKEKLYHKLLKQIKDRSLEKTFSASSIEFTKFEKQTTALGMASLVIESVFAS
jgi:predicted NBD/HSP70 family sugar kinase